MIGIHHLIRPKKEKIEKSGAKHFSFLYIN